MITKLKTYKENILVPRNLDGRQEKLTQEAIKLLSQETIDDNFKFEQYMLDIPDELIKVKNINGYFDCSFLNLIKLPKWFSQLTINDEFDCCYNKLTTLENCPHTINKNFYCNDNKLTILKGCTKIINGNFSCHNNQLISLEGCPETINGIFDCSINNLTSLEYGPKIVNGNYNCWLNNIKLQRPEDCIIKGKFYN